jgi:hypothetical protein
MSARIKPIRVRGRQLEEIRDADPDGRPVLHSQVIDPLARMLRAGTITDAMYNAARDFQAAFVIAHLGPLQALPMLRVPGTGPPSELNEFQLDARHRVQDALDALGGLSSPAGSCVACGRRRAQPSRLGVAPVLEWPTAAPGPCAGHPGRGARHPGSPDRHTAPPSRAGLISATRDVL